MKVGIHVHTRNKVGPFSEKYVELLKKNDIDYMILDINELDFWERIKECSHFIYHWGGMEDQLQISSAILPLIENEIGIKCFPNQKSCWHHDDKIRQYYLLKIHAFPIINSWIFWGKSQALNWAKDAKYPLVFKLKNGAGSRDVVKVGSYFLCKRIIKKIFGKGILRDHVPGNFSIKIKDFHIYNFFDKVMKKIYRFLNGRDLSYSWKKEKNYVLFQEFLPENHFDTRVTIIGDRAFSFRRHNRKNDFRSSGSGLIDYDVDKIDKNFVAKAFEISKYFKFQSMAYDFLYDSDGQIALCEMSYTYQDKAIYNCSGYWDSNLIWHEGHFWPQYFHLMDLLVMPDLKPLC